MPTPFTHLDAAQRFLDDTAIPSDVRAALAADSPAFMLGNIAADARTESGLKREDTHFYSYDKGISAHPWRVMMQTYPSLEQVGSAARRVFLAGYVAHLSMDEWWSLHMLGPHFVAREWAPRPTRFITLHILLIYMDDRDLKRLPPWQYDSLCAAQPDGWLPFMSDAILRGWRDFIAEQIAPGGESLTLQVLGGRVNIPPHELRAILDHPGRMDADLWAHITPGLLAGIEVDMYRHAREQLLVYWAESQAGNGDVRP